MSEPEKKKPNFSNAWKEARELIWVYRRRLWLGMSIMIVNRLSGLVTPATSKYLIDEVVGNQRAELLPTLAFAVAAASLVMAVSSFALSQVLGVAAQRAITEMRKTVQQHVARLPITFFDSTKTGILISRIMTDAEGIRNLVGTGLVQLTGGIVTAVLALGVLLYLNWQLTLYTVGALVVFGATMAYAFNRLRPIFRERSKLNATLTGRLAETLGGIRIVKAYTSERRERFVFAKGAHNLFRNIAKTITGISAVTAFTNIITGLIGVVMILVGGQAILNGEMTLGDFVMYLFFTGLMVTPLVQMASIGTQISEAFAGLDRIREIRQMATEDQEDAAREGVHTVDGEIRFEDVWFEYDTNVPVIRGVSVTAPAGSTTALVGSSGSGKSTLIGLVLAFSRPQQGEIYVDGRPLSHLKLRDYRKQVGVVLQENFLFDGTIAENIRFGKPDATAAEIEAVARVAHCDDFVREFENGYDTVVGERGVKLSGGQRQRIAIARAILADPRILILDEATSSLDSESEAMIQDALRALQRGRTTFVIAHRLSTIRTADQILVVEGGEIVESGTHDELLAANGRYRTLYDRQYAFERNRFINPGEELGGVSVPEQDPAEWSRGGRVRLND